MSQDETTSQEDVELTTSSEETLKGGEEDNSLSESKNQSNFKRLAKKLKQERKERERLQAEIAKLKSGSNEKEEEEDFDLEDEDESSDILTSSEARFFFIENPDAKKYREEMEELIEDNPKRKNLSLEDLYDLAKTRFPKSVSKKTIDISSGKVSDISKMDLSKMTAEEIKELPIEVYKKLRGKK